jgi:hypothetical protein
LDRKRKLRFGGLPRELKAECEQLGLFQARMPRFSQIFFYDFSDLEVLREFRQNTHPEHPAPVRAAKAYLRSGRRLESSCGISDIWYRHVELNAKHFVRNPPNPPKLLTPASAYPRPDEDQIRTREPMFEWEAFHCLQSETPAKTSAGDTLPSSHILVPSSSPLSRTLGHAIPQAKGDRAGKKPPKFKGHAALSSKLKVGKPVVEESSNLRAKSVSGVGLGKRKHEANEAQTEKKKDALKAKDIPGKHNAIDAGETEEMPRKPDEIKSGGVPGHADGTGRGWGFEEYPVEDWVTTARFDTALNVWLREVDAQASDGNKAAVTKQEGQGDKKREREEHVSDGRTF